MRLDGKTYRLEDKGRYGRVATVFAIGGLALSLVVYFVDSHQFFYSYLTAFVFWATIGLGGLFFVMLHHLVNARWSIVLRRLAESVASVLPYMAILFIPVLFGMHDLYHWSHADAVASDAILQKKAAYLNPTFFIIRAVLYFVVWGLLAWRLHRASVEQDGGHSESLQMRMRRISAPGMILFAITVTLAAFDWLMSLDAHWYSTIFGVYIFSGGVVGLLAFVTVTVVYLRRKDVLNDTITVEHYHDLGKLTFAFVVFWAYMAFSQYLLIWYANIPEETIWYFHRWEGSWKTATLLLVFGNFVVPFFILITRGAKRKFGFLALMCGWLLLMHFVDLFWVVMPGLHPHGVHISWIDLVCLLGIGGLFCRIFWWKFTSGPLVPVGDPRLNDSIRLTRS